MREAFSHPSVEGIIVWGGWSPTNYNQTCLEDKNYNRLPTNRLLEEWRIGNLTGVTNQDGVVEQTVFLGEYSVWYSHPWICEPGQKIVNVTKGEGILELSIHV